MSETPYNPDDPAFLASRALDEDLSEEEQQRLREALNASQRLRDEVEQLGAVDRLVKQWGTSKVELDWQAHAALVQDKAAGEQDEKQLDMIDRLLARWGGEHVEIDYDRFAAVVIDKVRTGAPRTSWRRLVYRIGAPLAAAAAVAIVATAAFRSMTSPNVVCRVVIRPTTLVADAGSSERRRVVALFDRTPISRETDHGKTPEISLLAMGSSPLAVASEEAPPL